MSKSRPGGISYRFLKPIELTFWAGIIGILIIGWLLPFNSANAWYVGLIALFAAVLAVIWFRWIIPHYGLPRLASYLMIGSILGLITILTYLLIPYGIRVDILFMVLVVCVGIIAPRNIALHTAGLAAGCEIILSLFMDGLTLASVISAGLKAGVLVFLSLVSNSVSISMIGQAIQTERQNRHLSMLLQTSYISTQITNLQFSKPQMGDLQAGDLQQILTQIAELIAINVPITACRISVLSSDRQQLVTYGAYPILPLDPAEVGIGSRYPIQQLPYLSEVLASGQPRILYNQEIEALIHEQGGPAFFYYGIQSLILIPLNLLEDSLGILSVGETGSGAGGRFDDEKMHLLQTLANGITSAIQSSQTLREARRQAQRLAMANEIGKAISSTIELDDLLELIYQELKKAMPSDTYYVALYLEERQALDMHLLIDDGIRFPPETIPLTEGLASWVLLNRQPLLIRNLAEEQNRLPAKPLVLGTERTSLSWLGVPLLANDRALGILAIASYTEAAFDEEDQMLLSSVAAQAGLAVDNARQHAKVKEQARRDSLTGAYNHGHLLHLLQETVDQDPSPRGPVSLIMLDIDFFKQYNDRYGHKVGDLVLCQLVEAIQTHVKKTDIVGRWGGEEFAVGLPGANAEAALKVAQRIRQTLADTLVHDKSGQRIPSPTVSQGIATYPVHAPDSSTLVDIADEALYRAKNSGRDQIVVAGQ